MPYPIGTIEPVAEPSRCFVCVLRSKTLTPRSCCAPGLPCIQGFHAFRASVVGSFWALLNTSEPSSETLPNSRSQVQLRMPPPGLHVTTSFSTGAIPASCVQLCEGVSKEVYPHSLWSWLCGVVKVLFGCF